MVRPYARLFRRYPKLPAVFSEPLEALDPDERIPIVPLLEGLRAAVQITGDEDLGLKAAREIALGDYGAIEFMVNSAPSLRVAIQLLGRYLPLINDALEFSLRVDGDSASVQLDSSVVLPRAAADFQSAAFYLATLRRGEHMVDPSYEAWFSHPRPDNVDEYQRTFAPGRLHFDAPWNGFVFDARRLDQPLTSADPQLHDVLRKYADVLLAELPKAESQTERVRALITQQLAEGEPSAERIARTLHMSRRTLARKLEQEGTSFKDLLDDTRRRTALRYVGGHDLSMTEIAFLLGFSQSAPFHRAFKRWTGQTPLEYRRAGPGRRDRYGSA
jgi:AraC-like DNA-binding protein